MTGDRPASHRCSAVLRALSSVRFDEVIVLQGAPLIGACLTVGSPAPGKLLDIVALMVGSLCLVAHIYLVNDLSGISGDLRDPNRAPRTFAAKGLTRREVGILAVLSLAVGLLVFGLLGFGLFVIALAMAGVSVLYSAPAFHLKGVPLVGSALHFVGETLHFLLGYGLFSAIDGRGVAIGCFFGLVYAAGHLMHEVRDRDGDLINGIRTYAVVVGRHRAFATGFALFTIACALVVVLAANGLLPRVLIFSAALYPLHLAASFRSWRAGLSAWSLYRLQKCYRLIFAIIGIAMIVTALLSGASRPPAKIGGNRPCAGFEVPLRSPAATLCDPAA